MKKLKEELSGDWDVFSGKLDKLLMENCSSLMEPWKELTFDLDVQTNAVFQKFREKIMDSIISSHADFGMKVKYEAGIAYKTLERDLIMRGSSAWAELLNIIVAEIERSGKVSG